MIQQTTSSRPRRTARRDLARTDAADGLRDRQRRAIAAILIADSVADAARISGISRRSLVRWGKDPVFRRVLAEASRARLAEAKDSLRAATVEAVQVLRAAQRNGTRSERIRAATAILDLARRLGEPLDDWCAPESASRKPLRNVIIVGGTETEYVQALKQLRWSDGDFDPDDSPEEIAAWRQGLT